MYNPSTPSNSKSLKLFQTYTLGTRFPGFAEGFLCRFPYLCQTKLMNYEL